MAKPQMQKDLNAIEDVLKAHPDGIAINDIAEALEHKLARRTLQRYLRQLLEEGKAISEGQLRTVKYFPAKHGTADGITNPESEHVPLSDRAKEVSQIVSQPLVKRKIVGYSREFLNSYRPNETAYLTKSQRAQLHKLGTVPIGSQPAGTYARKILDRLLIDLSWNSSRLEGNTYTLLDTKRLIDFGKEADGKDRIEAQMILNHKDAIEFLVSAADEIGFNRYTLLNLHGLLANNLLPNPKAEGRLRSIEVGIAFSG